MTPALLTGLLWAMLLLFALYMAVHGGWTKQSVRGALGMAAGVTCAVIILLLVHEKQTAMFILLALGMTFFGIGAWRAKRAT